MINLYILFLILTFIVVLTNFEATEAEINAKTIYDESFDDKLSKFNRKDGD